MASNDADILLISASIAGSLTLSKEIENTTIPPAIDAKYGNARSKKLRILSFMDEIVSHTLPYCHYGKNPRPSLEFTVNLYYNSGVCGVLTKGDTYVGNVRFFGKSI